MKKNHHLLMMMLVRHAVTINGNEHPYMRQSGLIMMWIIKDKAQKRIYSHI